MGYSRRFIISLLFMITLFSAVIVFAAPAVDTALATTTALEARGGTELAPYLDKRCCNIALFQVSAILFAGAAAATCSAAASTLAAVVPALPLVPACLGLILATTVAGLASFVGGLVSDPDTAKRATLPDVVQPLYNVKHHMPSKAWLHNNYIEGDHPLLATEASCQHSGCSRLWYSHSRTNASSGRIIRRLHATPHDFDFKAPKLASRQDDDSGGEVTSDDGSIQTFGGYVFDDEDSSSEDEIAGDSNLEYDVLSSAANSYASSFQSQGITCMGVGATDSGVDGTDGFFWYLEGVSSYDTTQESNYLASCGASVAAPETPQTS